MHDNTPVYCVAIVGLRSYQGGVNTTFELTLQSSRFKHCFSTQPAEIVRYFSYIYHSLITFYHSWDGQALHSCCANLWNVDAGITPPENKQDDFLHHHRVSIYSLPTCFSDHCNHGHGSPLSTRKLGTTRSQCFLCMSIQITFNDLLHQYICLHAHIPDTTAISALAISSDQEMPEREPAATNCVSMRRLHLEEEVYARS